MTDSSIAPVNGIMTCLKHVTPSCDMTISQDWAVGFVLLVLLTRADHF